MTLSVQDAQRVIEQESAWIDQDFAGIDLSSFPALMPPPAESPDDGRFAKSYFDSPLTRSGLDLKRFLANPDSEALARLSEETGDPELANKLRDERAGEIAQQFVATNPTYYRTSHNQESIILTLAWNVFGMEYHDADEAEEDLIAGGYWTLPNLSATFAALTEAGVLETRPGQPRTLTEHEKRLCALRAVNGDLAGAVGEYIKLKLGEPSAEEIIDSLANPESFVSDPLYVPVMNEAIWFCWEQSTTNYTPTPERRRFLHSFVAGRFLTLDLLNAAWAACQLAERDASRSALLYPTQQAETGLREQTNLDELDDAALENLYHATLRHYAKTAPKASPVYA